MWEREREREWNEEKMSRKADLKQNYRQLVCLNILLLLRWSLKRMWLYISHIRFVLPFRGLKVHFAIIYSFSYHSKPAFLLIQRQTRTFAKCLLSCFLTYNESGYLFKVTTSIACNDITCLMHVVSFELLLLISHILPIHVSHIINHSTKH